MKTSSPILNVEVRPHTSTFIFMFNI